MKTASFVRSLIGTAALALFAGQVAAETTLTFDDVSGRNTTNPQDIQCLLIGNSCPGGHQDMDYFGYQSSGQPGQSFDLTATPNSDGNDAGTGFPAYTVGYLSTYVGRVFSIGIDVNTADHQETLQAFEVRRNGNLEYSFYGPQLMDPTFNGNGFFDFTLSEIDFTNANAADVVTFRAYWNNASDGAENFFVYRGALPPIPEPSTYALMLAGLGAIGFMARRRRQG